MLDSTFNSVQQGYLSAVFFYFYIYIRCLRKPEKGKSMVRLGLNFCLFRVTVQQTFVVFCRTFVD